jgi:hypothetical protein
MDLAAKPFNDCLEFIQRMLGPAKRSFLAEMSSWFHEFAVIFTSDTDLRRCLLIAVKIVLFFYTPAVDISIFAREFNSGEVP